MALRDLYYQHWEGRHEGIWRRREVIAEQGLRSCLVGRWMRYTLAACWGSCFMLVAVLFVVGQLLVEDSLVLQWAATLQGIPNLVVAGLALWLIEHPEISVRAAENLLFYQFMKYLVWFNLIAVLLSLPHLITKDLSSRAILVYASKAVTRWDYLLGKLGALLGLMTLTWLGPVGVAWFMGNLLAPEWHFFWHSRMALGHALFFTVGSMLFLSILALGVSAVSPKEKAVVGLWLILWLLASAFVPLAQKTQPWFQYLSFRHDLEIVREAVFQPGEDLERLKNEIPSVRKLIEARRRNWRPGDGVESKTEPALVAMGIMLSCALLVLNARTKTE